MNASDLPIDGDAPGINRLFVTVGTDYHRFDRMVWWLDEWLAGEPKVGSVIVQRGTSAESERAESCLLYTSPSPRDGLLSRMPSSA